MAVINFAASLTYQLVNLLVGLILPKYYTEIFGSIYNGLNSSIAQIMSLLSVLQFGISAVSIQQMFKYIIKGDKAMISAIYWDAGKQYRKMGCIFLAIILPITAIYPFILQDDLPYRIVASFLLLRIISSAMEYFFQAKYSVILIAHNKSYAIYIVNTILLVIITLLQLLVLATVQNILLYQSVAVAVTVLRLVIVSGYVRRCFPFLTQSTVGDYRPPKESGRKDVLISEIAGMVIDSTDLLVLSILSGLVNASIYSVYNYVTTGLGNILSSCREAVFAGIGQTYYSNFKGFQKRMASFESVYLYLIFSLYTTAIVLFRPFIEVYTAHMDAKYYYTGLPVMFILARMLVNFRIPSIVAVNTAGHFKQVKYYAVIEAMINLGVSLTLVKPFGIYGVLIGTVAGALFRTPVLIHYASKYILLRKAWVYWRKVFLWIPFFLGGYFFSICKPLQSVSLAGWIIMAIPAALAVFAASLLWLLIFDRETLHELKDSIIKVLHKRGA